MKKRLITIFIILTIVWLLTKMVLIVQYNTGSKESVSFKEFDSYKEHLYKIAKLGLKLYRTEESGIRVFFSNGKETIGVLENGENIIVDERLSDMLLALKKLDFPCHIDYIIIGDSYVTFTRDGPAYAIMYSEDDVKPKGYWKYNDENLEVVQIEDCWYELKAKGLGVTP